MSTRTREASTAEKKGLSTPVAVVLAFLIATVIASIADLVIAAIARAAGASSDFHPLTASADISLTIVGILGGVIAWTIIRSRARRPRATMRWLIPTVVIVSLVPDLLLGTSNSQANTTWGAVIALMIMHIVVAAIAVVTFRILLPLPEDTATSA